MAQAQDRAAHVLYQSAFCRRCSLRFVGVDPASWEILPNAVDTHAFAPAASSRAPGPFRLLLTGKIGPTTGYRLLNSIEALARARKGGIEADLLVAGEIAPAVRVEADARVEAAGLARIVAGSEAFASSARARAVDRFSLDSWLDRHAAIFERLTGGSGR